VRRAIKKYSITIYVVIRYRGMRNDIVIFFLINILCTVTQIKTANSKHRFTHHCTGCADKNNPLEKLTYFSNTVANLSQTLALYYVSVHET